MRFLLACVIAFAAWACIGDAQAGTLGCSAVQQPRDCDEGQAFALCMTDVADETGWGLPIPSTVTCTKNEGTQSWMMCKAAAGPCITNQNTWYYFAGLCTARPPIFAGWFQGNPVSCMNGCTYGEGPKTEDWRITDSRNTANNINLRRGSFSPTGAVCGGTGAPAPPPPARDDYCADLSGGYKMCRDSKGRQCVVSGKTGRKYCGEASTGTNATNPERTENVAISPVAPSPGTPPPPPTPRPNENFAHDRTVTSTNTTNNTTSITNISNQAGTPNTNPGDGNPGDGSDNPGEGENDADKGSAAGGANCNAPPTCSGDPIACAVLDQTWRNRCGSTKGDENGNGRPDWTELGEGEGSNGPEPGNGDEVAKTWGMESLLDQVDDSGFIGAGCPAIPPLNLGPLGSFDVSGDWWCETLELIGGIFVFLASCTAIRILVS